MDLFHLISILIGALANLAAETKAQLKLKVMQIETTKRGKYSNLVKNTNAQFTHKNETEEICSKMIFLMSQHSFYKTLKTTNWVGGSNWDIMQYEAVYGFNTVEKHNNSVKACLLPTFLFEEEIKTIIIKKVKQVVSFASRNSQWLDILNFLGGATSVGAFSKVYKGLETKVFFRCEW